MTRSQLRRLHDNLFDLYSMRTIIVKLNRLVSFTPYHLCRGGRLSVCLSAAAASLRENYPDNFQETRFEAKNVTYVLLH